MIANWRFFLCAWPRAVVVVSLLVLGMLGGCRSVDPDDRAAPVSPAATTPAGGAALPRPEPTTPQAPATTPPTAVLPATDAATGEATNPAAAAPLPSRAGGSPVAAKALPGLAEQMEKTPAKLDEQLAVKLAFEGESLPVVVEAFGHLLGFQALTDPAVTGTVTLKLDTRMSRRQVWDLLEHLLWFGGAYLTPENGYLQVLPFSKMPQERRLFIPAVPQANVAASLVPVKLVPAANIAAAIQPFMTTGASATVVAQLNALLLIEAPANLAKLHELIQSLDQLGETKWPQLSLPCHNVPAKTVAEELQAVLPVLGFPVVTGGGRGDNQSIKLVAMERLQVLVVAAPTTEVLGEVQRWVQMLDREQTGEEEHVYFYDVKYNNADDLGDAIGAFFSATQTRKSRHATDATTSGASTTTGGAPVGASKAPIAPVVPTPAATAPTSKGQSDAQGLTALFDVPVKLFVDGHHNRLVLRTTQRAYTMVEALLQRLDTPPLQVLIQVSIAEIQLNKNTQFGIKYSLLHNTSSSHQLVTHMDPDNSGTAFNSGANVIFQKTADPKDVFGMVQAVAGQGNTKVLFAPQIIAISDEEASINVGDEVPVVTQENNAQDSANISRSIQLRTTGTILTVTPHITATRMVRLKLRQEVSDAVKTTTSTIDSPTIQTRKVESTLLVADGTTLLLGGLISTKDVLNDSGVPVLKDIPGLGLLFKSTNKEHNRQELVLLLTVNVIDQQSDLDGMVKRYKAALATIDASAAAPPPVRGTKVVVPAPPAAREGAAPRTTAP